jgi:hypothetical protein
MQSGSTQQIEKSGRSWRGGRAQAFSFLKNTLTIADTGTEKDGETSHDDGHGRSEG